MQAYRVISGKNLESLERVERAAPDLGPHEVRSRVGAVALNYRDLMIGRGDYPVSSDKPPIAIADGAGEVVELGPLATRFAVGDVVARIYYDDWLDGEPTAASLAKV